MPANAEIADRVGSSSPTVLAWRNRYAAVVWRRWATTTASEYYTLSLVRSQAFHACPSLLDERENKPFQTAI